MEESQKSLESTSADSKRRKSLNCSEKEEDDADEEEQPDLKKLGSNVQGSPPGKFSKTWTQKKSPKKNSSKKKKWAKMNSHKQPTLESLQDLPFMQTKSVIKAQQLHKA